MGWLEKIWSSWFIGPTPIARCKTQFEGRFRAPSSSPDRVIVKVCPAAVTLASPDRVWEVLTTPERFGEWQDATFVSVSPPGPVRPGQTIKLSARSLGRLWPVAIEVVDMDPQKRWIDLRVFLPLGIENHERVTLTETKDGGTLVRFN
jgi:hypothetical protein